MTTKQSEALKPVITFEVYSNGVRVGAATRSMRQHSGWESVVFQNRRYQLFGGIRTAHRINLEHPLGQRKALDAALDAYREALDAARALEAATWAAAVAASPADARAALDAHRAAHAALATFGA